MFDLSAAEVIAAYSLGLIFGIVSVILGTMLRGRQ